MFENANMFRWNVSVAHNVFHWNVFDWNVFDWNVFHWNVSVAHNVFYWNVSLAHILKKQSYHLCMGRLRLLGFLNL